MARNKPTNTKTLLGILGVLTVITVYIANFLLVKPQSLTSQASAGSASLFFQPTDLTIPTDSTINIWTTVSKPLGFADISFTFDPAKVQIAQDLTYPNTVLKRVIYSTPLADANISGRVRFTIAVDPTTVATAPSGTILLATVKLQAKTTAASDSATLSYALPQVQLVDMSAIPFIVSATSAHIALNPTPTPVPSITPSDTTIPTLTLTSRKGYGGRYVLARATDSSGIAEIKMMLNSQVVKTCTGTTSCLFKSGKTPLPFTMQVTATDNSSNHNVATSAITVN